MQKTVLITGASRGIGAALATTFAEAGYQLALCCKSSGSALLALTNELKENYQTEILTFTGDIADYAFVSQMVTDTLKHYGRIEY